MADWQKDILKLYNDFCLPTDKGRAVVDEVARQFPGATDELKYDLAWKKFRRDLFND